MSEIKNIDDIPDSVPVDLGVEPNLATKHLGTFAGSEKIYVNIDYVQPGAKSAKYHSHSLQEEFFLILKGSGILRAREQFIPVKKGDFFAKPAGRGIAHQFINNSNEMLQILDVGLNDKDDTIEYPDEDVLLIKNKGLAFNLSENIEDWSSDPNH